MVVVINCVSNFLCSLLLLSTVTPTDECIKEMCDKTLLIPAVEDWSIELPPCDVCTDCPTLPQTKHAWWYYRWPNGSQTAGFTAEVMDNRNYVVNVSLLQYRAMVLYYCHLCNRNMCTVPTRLHVEHIHCKSYC